MVNDSLTAEKDLDLVDDGEEIFTLKHLSGLLDVEIELTTTTEPQMDTLIGAGDDISITLTKGGSSFVKTANLITRANSAPRPEIQTTIVSRQFRCLLLGIISNCLSNFKMLTGDPEKQFTPPYTQ